MKLELSFARSTVLTTGAATGIGRATALAFAGAGASVVIGDVDASASMRSHPAWSDSR
ncbi:MAG TPA: hypothetical protein VFA72_22640 [Burkholderiales bacterium]|nr:hypothetical protein [Burkholderiales bacterium]